ncbi:acyltransferase [Aeromicrobium sp.]|uniref:acyltransferase family protein n=1 Tax=Aeromicrobium sp. TaxID=1871063 RepID=UPI0028B01A38|nr:acyltransferase [Aeromicrobium sp.]
MTTPLISPAHRFAQLDSIRAVAAIMVVATHTAFWAGVYTKGTWGAATQRLEVGVAIFFVLSGFLLSRPYLMRARRGTRTDSVQIYALKRVGRIMPVYLVTVVAAFILLSRNDDLGWDRFFLNITLTDFFVHSQLPFGLTQMWSLSVEASFYIVLPFIGITVLARSWRPTALLVGLLCVGLLGIVWLGLTAQDHALVARWLPSYALWFAMGIALAVIEIDRDSVRLVRALRRWASDRVACWVLAFGLFVIISTPLGGSPLLVALTPSESVMRHLFYAAIAVLIVAPCVFVTDDGTARILSHPWFRHLGYTSYALFCCHMIVLELVVDGVGYELFRAPAVPLFVLVLAVSLGVAEILYRVIEKPVIDAVHRRAKAARATAPRATAASN